MKNEQTALQLFSSDTTDRVVVAAPQLEPPLLHAAAGIRYGDQKVCAINKLKISQDRYHFSLNRIDNI